LENANAYSGGNESLISWKPMQDSTTGFFSIVTFNAELPREIALRIMKGSVYEVFEVSEEEFQESEMAEITYQQVPASQQKFQVNKADTQTEGQFIIFNKSGRCYVVFSQTTAEAKLQHQQAFEIFERYLEVQ